MFGCCRALQWDPCDLSLTVVFVIVVASQVGFYQTDTQIQTHHVKLLSNSYSDSVSLAVQIHSHFFVTFIFKFLKVFRFRVGFLMGLMSNLWHSYLLGLQHLRSAPGAFGSYEVYDMYQQCSDCTLICHWLAKSAAISHWTFTVHRHFWAMVRHSTTSERYQHKWKTHVAGGYKSLSWYFDWTFWFWGKFCMCFQAPMYM